MHTDDIFENLNIDQEPGKIPAEPKPASNDIVFEDLDMEEKIFSSALEEKKTPKTGAKTAAKTGASRKAPRELNTAESSIDRKTFKKEKEKKKKSRIKRFILAAIFEIFTLGAIFAYGYFLRSWNLIARPDVKIEAIENHNITLEQKEKMEKGYWNIAVFGVDGRSSSVVERGLNSDVIIIASINKANGDIKLVSVFRDTYLNVSDRNTFNKINSAYCAGGPEQALAALNKNLDLNLQNYITFNWKAVADGINILGGVDGISLSKAELYYINAYITETVKATGIGSYQLQNTGEQHLDGVQAVAYARLRYMDNDFARTERQRNVIKACFKKAKTADFAVLNNIMVTCFPQVATNINLNEIVAMAQNITKYNIADTAGFPWSRGDATIGKKGDCVIPTTLESNVAKLHEFLFDIPDYQPSSAVLSYSAKIKEDSKLYKEGKFIDSVSTDGGVIQPPKNGIGGKNPGTAGGGHGEDDEDEELDLELGVDSNGDLIYQTDEDGNYVSGIDEDGNYIYPTDADGNIMKETLRPRPTELSGEDLLEGELAPGEGESDIDNTQGGPGSSNLDPTRETSHDNSGNAPLEPAESGNSTTPGGGSNQKQPTAAVPGSGSGNTISPDGPTSLSTGGNSGPGGVPATTAAAAPGGSAPGDQSAPGSGNSPSGALEIPGGDGGPAGAGSITTSTPGPGEAPGEAGPG